MGNDWGSFWTARPFHKKVCLVAATLLCLFHIYTALFGVFDALMQRSVHLGLGLILVFLLFNKGGQAKPSPWSWILVLLSVTGIGYLLFFYDYVVNERFAFVTPLFWYEEVLGAIMIFVVLTAAKRVVSAGLLYCVIGFLVYPFIGPYLPSVLHTTPHTINDLLDFFYLSLGGIFGLPLGVSATDIALFIIFGSILMRTGGSQLISDIATSLTGRMTGGPAKVAILGSSFFGSITGSTSANVATVGSITIPMMKKAGYPSEFAASVEAAASCGGQMTPPVMGACAFVMSAFSGIPYATILRYALFPAILYYFSLFATVHIEAKKLKLKGVESSTTILQTLESYGHMIVPVVVLLALLISGYSPRFAGGYGILAAIAICQLRKKTRLSLIGLLSAFEGGAKNILIVMASTAAAGLIVGSVDITGFGQRISSTFGAIVGGSLFVGLMLGLVISFLLGLGMPTTPAYILQASTVIPALISLGLAPFAAHLYAFYYSCLALITPPDASAAYTAAAIADADGWKVGWLATRMALVAFIIPVMFAYNYRLLLVGPWFELLVTAVAAMIGIWSLAVACEGYFTRTLGIFGRVVAGTAAILLVSPSFWLLAVGAVLFSLLLLSQIRPPRVNISGEAEAQ